MRGRGVGFGTAVEAREAMRWCFQTEPCCYCAGSLPEEASPPFSVSLASMMTRRKKMLPMQEAASEAGGSQRRPWEGDGTQRGEAGEGRAPIRSVGEGKSRLMNPGEDAGRQEVGEEARGSQTDAAGHSADPG